jgi:hypothetical protein
VAALLGFTLALALAGVTDARAGDKHKDKHGKYDEEWSRSAQALEWTWRLSPGERIEIKGVNGKIEAQGTSGNKVEVSAVKRWKKSDPDEVRIEVIEHEEGITLCTVYPTPEGKPDNECEPGEGGRMSVNNNDVVVDYVVRVPSGVGFVGRTVNGGIEAMDLEGPAQAFTVNGSVRVETRDEATAETVNGSIVAAVGSASWRGALEFTTVNGSITLALPDEVAAQVRAETVNGSITTDFPLTVSGKFNRRKLSGTIGDSDRGGQLALTTVNGSIRLKSAR